MKSADLPLNEAQRLARLRNLEILDTLPQQAFDDITALASSLCGTPIALISLVDEQRQWFKSHQGLALNQTGRDIAFCAHAILQPDQVMVVSDATQDERFHDNPLVTDPASPLRFYAGSPIVTKDGLALGTVCVIDTEVRELSASQAASLQSLANLVTTLLEHAKLQREVARRGAAKVRQDIAVMQALLTSGRDLRSFVDRNHTYQFVNPAHLDYWGRQPDDIVGHRVADLMGRAQFELTIRPHLERALTGETVTHEAAIEFPHLGRRQFEVTYLPAWDDEGQVIGVVMRAQDIQQRQDRDNALHQALQDLQRKTVEQERFIHIISHDLREPINSINNFAGLLASDETITWPGKSRRNLDFVCQGGQRMSMLLNDLLEFVRLDRHSVESQRVDLNRVMDQVRDDLAMALERSSGRLTVDLLPTARGDPTLLRVALQNLVSNALKFVRNDVPPEVHVAHHFEGDALCLTVQDNGIGIAPDKIDAVFDLFKRLHSKKQYAGTGLGLSICRRIVELHGGSIHVSSTPVQGSCFKLSLPHEPVFPEESP